MRYVLAGRTYEIRDLDPSLDPLFTQLHAAYLGATPFPWIHFKQVAEPYLAKTSPRSNEHNEYFNNFTIVWNLLLSGARFDEAETLWEMALDPALETEANNPGHEIHKGTAYYFWGMTAILRGDIDKGYALMHQAVEEDVATTNSPIPNTPAYALATLNWRKQDQAFLQWVRAQASFLDGKQNEYSARYGRQFTLEDFRSRFLNSPPSTELAFLFAYSIARLMGLGKAPQHTVKSRFAGQLFMRIFSDMLTIIETALNSKNPGGGTFIHQAEFLSQAANDHFSNAKLGELNGIFDTDFDGTMNSLLDRSFAYPDNSALSELQSEIGIAYGLRNRAAHDVSPTPVMWHRFPEIMQSLLNVMFMTVDYLYP